MCWENAIRVLTSLAIVYKAYPFVIRRWKVCRAKWRGWKCWSRYGTVCTVISLGPMRVSPTTVEGVNGTVVAAYRLVLPLQVRYAISDKLETLVRLDSLYIDVQSKDKRERSLLPYRLSCPVNNRPQARARIADGLPLSLEFKATITDPTLRLGTVAVCKIVSLGSASVGCVTDAVLKAPDREVTVIREDVGVPNGESPNA